MTEPQSRRMVCIVGAPRCGTTSLSAYLRDHPDICFSSVKEPHFFSQFDLTSYATPALRDRVESDYLPRYFPNQSNDGRILAEGSVSYLYAPEQMDPILRLWPDTRFVIAVRDPMEMLASLHLRLLYLGDEVETDFERAWSLAPVRRQGQQVPRACIDPRWLAYDQIARLGQYAERFIAAVGRERCFISVFDDLTSNPEAVYRQLLEFLELPYHPRKDFTPKRTSRSYRWQALQRWLKRPPKFTRTIFAGQTVRRHLNAKPDKVDPYLIRLIFSARKRILRWNTIEATPCFIPWHLQVQIREQLRDDIACLSGLIGRNLDHWLASERSPLQRDAA